MLIDRGFSHAIAKAVLEDSPENQSAKDILNQPENRIVFDSGEVVDLGENAIAKGLKEKLSRFTAVA